MHTGSYTCPCVCVHAYTYSDTHKLTHMSHTFTCLLMCTQYIYTQMFTSMHTCSNALPGPNNYVIIIPSMLDFVYAVAPWESKRTSSYYRWRDSVGFLMGSEHIWPSQSSVINDWGTVWTSTEMSNIKGWQKHSRGCSKALLKIALVPNTGPGLDLCAAKRKKTPVLYWHGKQSPGWLDLPAVKSQTLAIMLHGGTALQREGWESD